MCEHLGARVNVESYGQVVVAVKIVHTTRSPEVRFGDQATAKQYGGLDA